MKIKNKLIVSYIVAMLAPILGLWILFILVKDFNKEVEFKDYINNMKIFEKYSDTLNSVDLYKSPNKKILSQIPKQDNIKVVIYDKYGTIIYSSVENYFYFSVSKESLYKNLYDIKQSNKFITLKKPVFEKEEIVGFYEITILRTEWLKGLNSRTAVTIISVVSIFIMTFVMILRVINRKINLPIGLLVKSMKKFAIGENEEIHYCSNDEIGELILRFDSMKKQIGQKNKELREEQKSKEYMISAVSHDLKTPLTSIRAYTELLKRNDIKECEKESYTSIILNKCDYMSSMVENLLMYSVLTTEYEMNLVSVEGEEFFDMLSSGYEEICKTEEVIYIKEVGVKGNYSVDVNQMIRVMDNVISNGVRYTEKGKKLYLGIYSEEFSLSNWINSKVREKLEDIRKDKVVIIVKNEGKGIDNQEIENVFKPFYKADNSRRNTKNSGTGLGLSIVKLIIEKHGGEVMIISEEQETMIIMLIKKDNGGKYDD